MIRFISVLSVSLVLFAASLAPAADADRIDTLIESQMRQKKIPGVSLAIVRDGQVIKTKGYGYSNLELRAPVTEQTVFEIGSLTKQFTAVLVMMLASEGKIGLDDKLARYFEVPAAWQGITIRHLLNHTSGLKNYTSLSGFEASRKLKAAEFIKLLARQPLDFQPGEDWRYCNSGYNLLGYLLEKQSGLGYWELLAARILRPLQMNSTGNRIATNTTPGRAVGYEWNGRRLSTRNGQLTDVFSAGAIVSTAPDLVKWSAALETDELLKKPQRDLLFVAAQLKKAPPYPYGFGWRLDDYKKHKNLGHSGSTAGFSSSLQKYPEDKLTIIVLCNISEPGIATVLARQIADLFLPPR